MAPPTPVEFPTEGHTLDELDVLRSVEPVLAVDSTAMETADAAAVRASRMSPTASRSTAAMHSIMEQGTYILGLF